MPNVHTLTSPHIRERSYNFKMLGLLAGEDFARSFQHWLKFPKLQKFEFFFAMLRKTDPPININNCLYKHFKPFPETFCGQCKIEEVYSWRVIPEE